MESRSGTWKTDSPVGSTFHFLERENRKREKLERSFEHFASIARLPLCSYEPKKTLRLVLEVIDQTRIPIQEDQALNERMYGDLQGLNKAETAQKYGEQQVKIWRRSYDIPPPGGESLKDTAERVLPYYQQRIQPELLDGKTILVVAHGNSLRALVMHLDQLSREEVLELNIPTGAPLLYELDEDGKTLTHRYL